MLLFFYRSIAIAMRYSNNPADFFQSPNRLLPNINLFRKIIQHFSPSNCLIIIATKNLEVSSMPKYRSDFRYIHQIAQAPNTDTIIYPILDFMEPYYKIPFTICEVSHLLLAYWSFPSRNIYVHLPHFNEYISDFTRIDPISRFSMEKPVLISDTPSRQIWVYSKANTRIMKVKCLLRNKNGLKSTRSRGNSSYFTLTG